MQEVPTAVNVAPVQLAWRISLGVIFLELETLPVLYRKLQGIPSIDAHPCLDGKDLVPAHYVASRFASFDLVSLGLMLHETDDPLAVLKEE